jgi:hypothetical protein
MAQAYSDPTRADDPHALPNIEVFHVTEAVSTLMETCFVDPCPGPGWYWWPCFPGCLPDSDPMGPFGTEAEALADAQDID